MKAMVIRSIGAAAVLVATVPGTVRAGGGSEGWAVAGALIGGMLLGQMSAPACAPAQVVAYPVPVAVAPPPVVYAAPQVAYAYPPPVVVAPQTVVYAQPQVVYAQPQVVYAQPQVVYASPVCVPRVSVVYSSSRWGSCPPRPCGPVFASPHHGGSHVVVRRTSYGRCGR